MKLPPENCIFCNSKLEIIIKETGYRHCCSTIRPTNSKHYKDEYYKYRLWGIGKFSGVEISFEDITLYNNIQEKYTYIHKYGQLYKNDIKISLIDFDYSSPETVRKQLDLILVFA